MRIPVSQNDLGYVIIFKPYMGIEKAWFVLTTDPWINPECKVIMTYKEFKKQFPRISHGSTKRFRILK